MTTVKIQIEIPKYDPGTGFKYKWESNFVIMAGIVDGVIQINANKAGLLSLANHLLNLAQESVPPGTHLHLDNYNSLEEGSNDLIIGKVDEGVNS